eukprot:Nk52_evm9s376 gene=Nk52_evmTU9s376
MTLSSVLRNGNDCIKNSQQQQVRESFRLSLTDSGTANNRPLTSEIDYISERVGNNKKCKLTVECFDQDSIHALLARLQKNVIDLSFVRLNEIHYEEAALENRSRELPKLPCSAFQEGSIEKAFSRVSSNEHYYSARHTLTGPSACPAAGDNGRHGCQGQSAFVLNVSERLRKTFICLENGDPYELSTQLSQKIELIQLLK